MEKLLKAKRNFLNARQVTIEKLQDCCDLLESQTLTGKYVKIEEGSKYISVIGKPLSNFTFGLIEIVGEGISAMNNTAKRKFEMKNSKEFQQYLIEEENNLSLLSKSYDFLINDLKENRELEISSIIINALQLEDQLTDEEIRLFNNKHEIYKVATRI
jgi:hypothetical protein